MTDKWVWNQYWHADRIASCFDDAGARNYDDFVASGWRTFFGELPDGARVLDLCTGNGAVAILAAESPRKLKISAVDQASIDPRLYVSRHAEALARIDFIPEVNVEALPFDAGTFDAVVSQYGVEYSDLDLSLPEIGRVVAAGGRARLAMHAAEGSVAATTRRSIPEIDFLLDDLDLVGKALACFEAVTSLERDPRASAETRADAKTKLGLFQDGLRQSGERIAQAADPDTIRNAGAILIDLFNRRGQHEVGDLMSKAEKVRTELKAHRGRLDQLLAAAVTRAEADKLARRLSEVGARETSVSDLRTQEYLLGHIIEGSF